MAKKGVGIRLWFRKLSIKRFQVSAQRKRRSSPHHLPGLSSSAPNLHGLISSPYHTLNSDSTHSSPHHSPPAITFSSFSSPHNPLSAYSPTPWRHNRPPMSPLSYISPCTSPTPGRWGRGRASKNSQCQASYMTTAVLLLSPINHKAMDIPYPSGESSPATLLQSPMFQGASVASSAKTLSPPLNSAHSHIVLFRSPLHPLAHLNQSMAVPQNQAKPDATRSLDIRSSREAKVSVNSSQKETTVSANRKSAASAGYSQAQYGEAASSLKESAQHSRAQQGLIRASSTKQPPLVVDCGCRPNLSSSFRKTKKTLQACGSCSGSKHVVVSAHDRCKQAMEKLKGLQGGVTAHEESKISALTSADACNNCHEEACILFPKQGLHSHAEVLSHKTFQQLRIKRKKKMHSAANASPTETSNLQNLVQISPPLTVERKGSTGRNVDSRGNSSSSLKDGAVMFPEGQTLTWEKDFSSFTSEDTFFSSFERSRPSFSSNSSSECFDKKRSTNLASSSTTGSVLGSNSCQPHCYNPATSRSNNIPCQGASPKPGDPLIAISFDAGHVNEDKKVLAPSKPAMAPASCRVVSSEPPMCGMNTKAAGKRGCVNPLVGIKEVSCEEGNTSTTEQGNLSREGYTGRFLNMQKNSGSNPDYVFGSHSDYYASVRGRNIRARRKSDEAIMVQAAGAGGDTGSARSRRRAQLQAKWMLREERIHWQSSVDESEVDAAAGDGNGDEENPTNCLDHETPVPRQRRSAEVEPKLHRSKEAAPGIVGNSSAQTKLSSNDSKPEGDGDQKEEKSASFEDTQSSFGMNSRLTDSVAVVKSSRDPLVDFRDSMMDMIVERQIYTAEDLGELLRCFLSLNPSEHHDTIVSAFMQVSARIFHGS